MFCLPVTLFFCGSKIFVAIRRGVFFQGEFVCYEIDTGRKSHFFPLRNLIPAGIAKGYWGTVRDILVAALVGHNKLVAAGVGY